MTISQQTLESVLSSLPHKSIGVLGDLFLDRYLDIDAALTEPSIETGLDAYQVVAVRSYPGAAGTVLNNLSALGVGRIHPIAVIGDDGEGYELRAALNRLPGVVSEAVYSCPSRRTPTYTKPMLHETPTRSASQTPTRSASEEKEQPARELNRLDIKNRSPMPAEYENKILFGLEQLWESLDVLLVLDQVSEEDCGVVTSRVRDKLIELGRCWPDRIILADSRERIDLFPSIWLKPNQAECVRAAGGKLDVESSAVELAERGGRPVFCTCSNKGILVVNPGQLPNMVPACKVTGPIDPVGAGDSTSAAIASALAAGASLEDAAFLGNLVASITIQQLGTTGTASPEQVRQRWGDVSCGSVPNTAER